jgi:hypothetical protein
MEAVDSKMITTIVCPNEFPNLEWQDNFDRVPRYVPLPRPTADVTCIEESSLRVVEVGISCPEESSEKEADVPRSPITTIGEMQVLYPFRDKGSKVEARQVNRTGQEARRCYSLSQLIPARVDVPSLTGGYSWAAVKRGHANSKL